MRAWRVAHAGAPSGVLDLVDVDPPEPGPGFVRLRVIGAALGLPDVMMCAGTYPLTPPLPFTPGQEVVGEVTAVGPGVDPALIGTRRMGVTAFFLGHGGFAEEALAAEATIFPVPEGLGDVAAAGFHIAFLTAWIGLRDRADARPGETLVVLGASGGSGSAAVLLGRALDLRVLAVAGGADKAAYCRGLGAHEVVDHSERDIVEAVRAGTDGRGADIVFDPVGSEAGEAAVQAMAGGGRFLLVGFAGGRWPSIEPALLVRANLAAIGVYTGASDRAHALEAHRQLFDLRRRGRLGDLPAHEVGFEDLPGGLDALGARTTVGKSVLRVAPTA